PQVGYRADGHVAKELIVAKTRRPDPCPKPQFPSLGQTHEDQLAQITDAFDRLCFRLCLAKRRQEQGGQNRYNGNHDEQLDECEPACRRRFRAIVHNPWCDLSVAGRFGLRGRPFAMLEAWHLASSSSIRAQGIFLASDRSLLQLV